MLLKDMNCETAYVDGRLQERGRGVCVEWEDLEKFYKYVPSSFSLLNLFALTWGFLPRIWDMLYLHWIM